LRRKAVKLMSTTNWDIYPLTIASQQHHIDQSEHFLSTIQPNDRPIVYWSIADPTGLVLGFSQKHSILNSAAATSLPIYHRRAGGTAVLVGPHLLGLDVILPAGHALIHLDIVESYRWFGDAWVATLQQFGVEAHTVSPTEAHIQRALRKDPQSSTYELLMYRACYGSLSAYEVVVGQCKVVGFDMIRRRVGTLLQAGLLLHWDTTLLAYLLGHTAEEQTLLRTGLQERAVGLDILVGRVVSTTDVISAFEQVLLSKVVSHLSTSGSAYS
jgi:lipoate---protein ligase